MRGLGRRGKEERGLRHRRVHAVHLAGLADLRRKRAVALTAEVEWPPAFNAGVQMLEGMAAIHRCTVSRCQPRPSRSSSSAAEMS